jgi:hypothetical protein
MKEERNVLGKDKSIRRRKRAKVFEGRYLPRERKAEKKNDRRKKRKK